MQRQIAKPDTREVKERPARFEGWGKYILVGTVFLGIVGYGTVNSIQHRAHPDADRSYMNSRAEADRSRDDVQGRERKSAADAYFRSQREYSEHRAEADRNRDEAYRNRNMNYRVEAEAKNKADAGMDK